MNRSERRATAKTTVLVVDDEADIRELLELTLVRMGLSVECAGSVAEALEQLKRHTFDLCLTDMRLPDGEGLELVRYIGANCSDLPVAVITAHGSTENAVAALKAGAFAYVSKPLSLEQLRTLVKSALDLPQKAAPKVASGHRMLGDSPPIQQVRAMIEKIARSQAPVYITGESGSGKELAARLIHENGARRDKAFVPVNCGAIGAARIRAIVRDLATFSRGHEPEAVRPVDVNRALELALEMAERQITARARLARRLGELPPVLGTESRLSQAFLNLLVNAAQSIPEGDAARHEVRVATAYDPQRGRVTVEIADTGHGIAPEDQARIFDAFFTTRPVGHGNGLGLSISHSIVTSLGGEIAVQSAPGQGTTGRVLLPAAERGAAPAPGARARVLVVDDKPLVGAVVQRLLSPPHEVLAVTSAHEAMALLDAGARFDRDTVPQTHPPPVYWPIVRWR